MRDSEDLPYGALILHDQALVVDLISLTLNHGLFAVKAARDLDEAAAILRVWLPTIAVVEMDNDHSSDLMRLIGASGAQRHGSMPVIGLTRRGDLRTKLDAFDRGVDDVLTVPFPPEELLARALVVARRALGTAIRIVPTIRLGEMEIDILNREVRTGDSIVHLSGIEQSLLYLFACRAGEVLSRDEILDAVWGTDFLSESNIVDRHVRSLRIKLQNDYRRPRFIATVPGQGYRFVPVFGGVGWNADSRAVAVDGSRDT